MEVEYGRVGEGGRGKMRQKEERVRHEYNRETVQIEEEKTDRSLQSIPKEN